MNALYRTKRKRRSTRKFNARKPFGGGDGGDEFELSLCSVNTQGESALEMTAFKCVFIREGFLERVAKAASACPSTRKCRN